MLTPYPYQEQAIQSIYDYYSAGNDGNPVIAMPTATGKALVIAEFVKRTVMTWRQQRIVMLTHVKELIKQNADTLLGQWPDAPIGIVSAGLNQRNAMFPIVFGGVGTVVNCTSLLGWRDLLIIDEAHLLSPEDDTNYQQVIADLSKVNPNLRVIGLTATPYRLKQGLITDGGIFTDICFNNTGMDDYNKLIAEGYLTLLVPKPTATEFDISQVKITAGEFNNAALEAAVNKDKVTYEACLELVAAGEDRISWMIFASGVKHADNIALMLTSMGIDAVSVHSKMPHALADKRIADFQLFKHRAIVNYGKLTTGFNHKPIDLIGMMRPTMSPGLWVQMLGRGGRISPETHKRDCLVLDFARNTLRLGPVNDPTIPRKKVKGAPGVMPVKICAACGMYNHCRVTHCASCGCEFPILQKLTNTAGTDVLVRQKEPPKFETFDVSRTVYTQHIKEGSPPMLKAQYICGLKTFNTYVAIEHPITMIASRAKKWWIECTGGAFPPKTTAEALLQLAKLREPKTVRVWTNKKYPEVMGCTY